METKEPTSRSPLRFTFYVLRFAPVLLWLTGALLVTALAARFAMRAIGVRDDVPAPRLVYAFTAPLVEPFYRFFPASERFDIRVVEVASLAAAGAVIALVLAVYVIELLTLSGGRRT